MPESVLFDVLSTLAADTIHISTFSTAYQGTEVASGSRFRPLDPRCLVLTYMPAISTSHEMLWRKRLYEVLSRTVASNCLHKLRVGPIERYDVACLTALGDFLFHAGRHTLQDFALPFSITQPLLEVEDKQERWNMLRLDECKNLRSFGVSFQIRTRFGRLPLVLPHVPYSAVAIAILSHLPSTLRQLTIELIDVETDEQIKNKKVLGLRALDDALVDRFPVLEVVRVELRVEYYLLEYTTAVFKTMPKWGKKATNKPLARVGYHSLPIEVLDTVFKHSSKSTLLVCSRVSHLWRDFALPHLFASIEVIRCLSYDDFFDFLVARPRFARYIRSLKLGYKSLSLWSSDPGRPLVHPPFLMRLSEALPRLGNLSLEDIWVDSAAPPVARDPALDEPRARPLGTFKLQQLSLEYCRPAQGRTYDLPTLFDILSALPTDAVHVTNISINVTQPFGKVQLEARRLPPLAIRSLCLDKINVHSQDRSHAHHVALCNAFRQMLLPGRLHTFRLGLEIDRQIDASLNALGELIQHAGKGVLRDYALPLPIKSPVGPEQDKADYWRILRLKEFPILDTFRMSLILPEPGTKPDYVDAPRVPLSTVCIAILVHLPPCLRTLEVTLQGVKEIRQLKSTWMLDLRRLDDALQEYFPALEKFRVIFKGDWYLLEFTTTVFKLMPKTRSRGVLEVVDWLNWSVRYQ
ncbi:hypothetical protein GY45DRAFT_1374175 [Cubamyces sp. BRFM 1775]|nr:hypothetical protein GY45DRAFT_1374175 [Cubamyces sp. BRFM 1775]